MIEAGSTDLLHMFYIMFRPSSPPHVYEITQLRWDVEGVPSFRQRAFYEPPAIKHISGSNTSPSISLDGDYVCILADPGLTVWDWKRNRMGYIPLMNDRDDVSLDYSELFGSSGS